MLKGDLYRASQQITHLVIVCHGLGMDKDHRLMKSICEKFSLSGVNAFTFSFSGYAHSDGKQQNASYTKQARVLCSVIDYLPTGIARETEPKRESVTGSRLS